MKMGEHAGRPDGELIRKRVGGFENALVERLSMRW